ncbi:hypothetical protein BJV78DRAFT_1110612, partial [Lactifluus subvellereus]
VPQWRYKPQARTSGDRHSYVDEVNLKPLNHFFMQTFDEEGTPLRNAMQGRFTCLVARDERMFQEHGPSISVVIGRQIPTKYFRSPPEPITRAKLAKDGARSVLRFVIEDGDLAWAVGPHKINAFD